MEISGEQRIAASRQAVWEALNDPEVLKQAIPGCQEIEKSSDTEFAAKVRAKVGPVSATFNGRVTLSDLNPPESYTISGDGQGGAAGFAKGSAKVSLSEEGEATLLRYEASAQVGGKLAQIGSRLIVGTARKMADDFFSKFGEIVAGPVAMPTAAEETELAAAAMRGAAPGSTAPAVPAGDEARRGLSPIVWIGGLIIVVVILLAIFSS